MEHLNSKSISPTFEKEYVASSHIPAYEFAVRTSELLRVLPGSFSWDMLMLPATMPIEFVKRRNIGKDPVPPRDQLLHDPLSNRLLEQFLGGPKPLPFRRARTQKGPKDSKEG